MASVVMLNVAIKCCYAERHYTKCHYAVRGYASIWKCSCAERHHAEWHKDGWHSASTVMLSVD
jgi:hypothetical protein